MAASPVSFPERADLQPQPIDLTKQYIVRSLNCTANKPLHLGHLRNAVLGAAQAASLKAVGATVLRHLIVEDGGREMAEAMAGVRESEVNGTGDSGVPPDRHLGMCYAGFHKRAAVVGEAAECEVVALLREIERSDPLAVQLLDRVRKTALDGIQATVQQIGLTFDFCDFESAEDPLLPQFIADCTWRGLLRRTAEGELAYPKYGGGTLRLLDRFGIPDESTRLLSYNRRLADTAVAGHVTIAIAGAEWKDLISAFPEFLFRMGRANSFEHYFPFFHGMVTLNGQKMASSTGTGLLVDDMVEKLARRKSVRKLIGRADATDAPKGYAAMLLKSFLLAVPRIKAIDFPNDADIPEEDPAWAIVSAWATVLKADKSAGALSSESHDSLLHALSLVSFEAAMQRLHELATRISEGHASSNERKDFIAMARALPGSPRCTKFAFSRTPSLLAWHPNGNHATHH
jgi:hypothetical protein